MPIIGRAILILALILIVSEFFAALSASVVLYGLRRSGEFAQMMWIVLTSIWVDQICQFVSAISRTPGPRDNNKLSVAWWLVGRLVRSAALWWFTLSLIRIRKREIKD